ncbi:hypothetical protein TUM20286_05740 [Pseudomonas tohonis]|uniref:Helix-turn-helix domain-containing protein n=2 Tax=Pseudomonas TaxID=286 RepID=A0ABQ4VSZ6_9PSED|nr:hypothetical protein TUM20286_05740 [Pseudomonas tohonis]
MSTVIMSACWPLQGMTATQKAVLISLADNANDEGVCWPSVSNISLRTCLSERAVQGAIKWLCSVGALATSDRTGRSTVYTVTPEAYAPPQELHPRSKCTPADGAGLPPQELHPRSKCTPADGAGLPPQELHPTPADGAPHPRSSCTQNRNRTKREPSEEPQSSLPTVPAGQRKGKRPTKAQSQEAELARQEACRSIWTAYSAAYLERYAAKPVRNAKVNSQVGDLLKRLGAEEAPAVAAYFVGINDAYLIRSYHEFGQLLAKAEAYRTAWATQTQVTGRTAQQAEKTQANLSAAQAALQVQRERRAASANA